MQVNKLIHNMDFCYVVSDKFENVGVKRNNLVYVAGHKALPISEEDPYTQRIKFFCHLCDNEGNIDTTKLYLVDPDSIQKVSKSLQKKLMKKAKKDYGENSPN